VKSLGITYYLLFQPVSLDPLPLLLLGHYIVKIVQVGDSSATDIDQIVVARRQFRKHIGLLAIIDQLTNLTCYL